MVGLCSRYRWCYNQGKQVGGEGDGEKMAVAR